MDWQSSKKIFFNPVSLSSSVIRIVHAMILFLLCFIFINRNRLNKKISQVTYVNVEFIFKKLPKNVIKSKNNNYKFLVSLYLFFIRNK